MTLTLTRDDFAHMTRLRAVKLNRWQVVCSCGWESQPAVFNTALPRQCPNAGQPVPPKAEDWYPGTLGTHYAGQPLEPVTPESIAAAKADRDRERRAAEQELGIRILEDGTIIHPPTRQRVH